MGIGNPFECSLSAHRTPRHRTEVALVQIDCDSADSSRHSATASGPWAFVGCILKCQHVPFFSLPKLELLLGGTKKTKKRKTRKRKKDRKRMWHSSKEAQLPTTRVFFYNWSSFCWLPGDGTTQMAACTWRLLKCLFWMHLDYPWALFNPLKSTLGSLMISVNCFADGSAFMEGSWGGGGVLVGFTEIQDLHILIYLWGLDALLCPFPTTEELSDHAGFTNLAAKLELFCWGGNVARQLIAHTPFHPGSLSPSHCHHKQLRLFLVQRGIYPWWCTLWGRVCSCF